jgi:hypothetical protein
MDFKDEIKQLGDRIAKLKESIHTEEATKNAFIMPFIKALGYDVFNPTEVVPEFISDIGIKKGEKIDYAIFKDGQPTILVECKHWRENLDLHDGQLLRYFHVSKAKFGILTNGITYRFYTDLVEPNKMDEKPFLEYSINDLRDNHIEELKKFHKSYFNVSNILTTASELKYTAELKNLIHNEINNPSPEFVKHFTKQVYPSMITQKVLDQFTILTKKSFSLYLSDLISERLKSALKKEEEDQIQTEQPILEPVIKDKSTETTQDELDAYHIIRSILRQKIAISRIFYRDAQSYFSILLDDNNRKPICRLYLTANKKQIVIIENKVETKFDLLTLDDLFKLADNLIKSASSYDVQNISAN